MPYGRSLYLLCPFVLTCSYHGGLMVLWALPLCMLPIDLLLSLVLTCSYHGGLAAYISNAKRLLSDSKEGG